MVDVGLDEGVGGLDCGGGEEVGLGGGGWHGENARDGDCNLCREPRERR